MLYAYKAGISYTRPLFFSDIAPIEPHGPRYDSKPEGKSATSDEEVESSTSEDTSDEEPWYEVRPDDIFPPTHVSFMEV